LEDKFTSVKLIDSHRELNKRAGAKAHLATPEGKVAKLRLKEEIVARAQQGDSVCHKYATERRWLCSMTTVE
jgi:hypothetical protein